MRGAIAAGNRHSADAGAWALREGGTAVDAAVAATLAAFVMEGPLTGPGGGGFALLHEPGQGATLLDCFFAVPLREAGEMEEVEIVGLKDTLTGHTLADRAHPVQLERIRVSEPVIQLAVEPASVMPSSRI